MRKKSSPLFIAILESGKQYIGGNNYSNPKWKEINEKVIKIFFRLPDENLFVLHNYEKYLYLIEGSKDFLVDIRLKDVKEKTKSKVENIYFMGLKNGIVDSYRVSIFKKSNDRYKIGDITKRQYKWEDIQNKYTGWK
ncbi:hypothetical protein LCGC14_1166390 [marine sediment metagenome]|uniref:Uncharacterized protein n=1 Tax=marine sediment metagenome TaxID=412755 RepID=A0A0F9PWL9_9ZZZZ